MWWGGVVEVVTTFNFCVCVWWGVVEFKRNGQNRNNITTLCVDASKLANAEYVKLWGLVDVSCLIKEKCSNAFVNFLFQRSWLKFSFSLKF